MFNFIGGLAAPIARVDAVAMKQCLSMLGIEPVFPAGNTEQSVKGQSKSTAQLFKMLFY